MRLLAKPSELKETLTKLWESGALLSLKFPASFKLKVPSAKDFSSSFAACQSFAKSWQSAFPEALTYTGVNP